MRRQKGTSLLSFEMKSAINQSKQRNKPIIMPYIYIAWLAEYVFLNMPNPTSMWWLALQKPQLFRC